MKRRIFGVARSFRQPVVTVTIFNFGLATLDGRAEACVSRLVPEA